MTPPLHNWAGNLRYRAAHLAEPRSVDELQQLVRSTPHLRVLGSRHSFSDIADTTGTLVSLARLPGVFELDAARSTVTIDGAVRYGDLCARLDAAGVAVHNLASLPHISVAGAVATATHGSGDGLGCLATAVSAIDLVTADGSVVTVRRGDPDFPGAVVGLGAAGVVVRLTLDLVPASTMRQLVYEDLPLATAIDHFDELTAAGDSVSLFTRWREPTLDMVWLKQRVDPDSAGSTPDHLFGARAATVDRHPIRGLPAEACTPQLGVPGPWYQRQPHFRLEHTPSAGDELQSEYLVPRTQAGAALTAVQGISDTIAPLVQVSEIRTVAADDLWLSMAHGRASVALHFTWVADTDRVLAALSLLEAALEPFDARPHWGKLFTMPASTLRARYPRWDDARALVGRLDPAGAFRNLFLDRTLFGVG